MGNQVEWTERVAALAKIGLHYALNRCDEESYQQLFDTAADMLANAAEAGETQVKLALAADDGYITPKVDVRGAVFRDGKALLVREAVDGRWTLPG